MTNDKEDLERVRLKPLDSIIFVGRLDTIRETYLSMFNPNVTVISFKIKQSKHVTATPHYGYIRPQAELLIKLKARVMKHITDKEKLVISLTKPPKKAPRNAKELWADKKNLAKKFTRKIPIVFKPPQDQTAVSEKSESSKTDDKSKEGEEDEDTKVDDNDDDDDENQE